ncbi:restriction endonuclease subunit S [Prevotella intermedia]|uniref:restriction endonuclease subunit S n=1 Tax=Prevotella intermedia TaxID=28131 RepID=UPI0004AF6B20|nr:restriction endonuclease subunit S [Prevotella intermedia]
MNAAAKSYDGENKYIRITDIDESSSTYDDKDIVSPDGTLSDNYLVKERDILLARTGASTGKTYLYRKSDGKLYYAGFLIRANVTTHNPYFVFSQLHTHRYWRWVSIMSARSGQPGINSQEYSSFPVFTTSIQEENKIAKLLSLLDDRISTQNKIIDKLQSLIKGISNRLLYADNSMSIRIEEMLIERSERTKKNNQYEILSSTVNGIFSQRDYFSKDIASDNNVGYKIIHLHDIVLSPQNLWMGNINFNDKFDIGIVSPSYKVFSIADGFDKKYVAALLKTHHALYNYMLVSEQGASIVRRNLNYEAFEQLVFKIPSLNKQQEIGHVISLLKSQLENANLLIKTYNSQKQYLLRQMFI